MQVKVECSCGTRFEFEVEPVRDRMPMPIACPSCNADATGLANEVIRRQTSPPPPQAATPAQHAPANQLHPLEPSVPTSPHVLRISKSTHAPAPVAAAPTDEAQPQSNQPASAADASGAQMCPKHKNQPAVEHCLVCKKPMCGLCMEQFGRVCSVFCREQSVQKRIYVPPYAGQKSAVQARSNLLTKCLVFGVVALIAAGIGLEIWYKYYARNPKVVYSLALPKSKSSDNDSKMTFRPDEFYQLAATNLLLSVKAKHVNLYDLVGQKMLWSTLLESDVEIAAAKARSKGEESMFDDEIYFGEPHAIVTAGDVWLTFPNRVMRFDRQTGAHKDLVMPGAIINVTASDDMILVRSFDAAKHQTLTGISLPGGTVQTEELSAPPKMAAVAKAPPKTTKPPAAAGTLPADKLKNVLTPSPQPDPASLDMFSEMSEAQPYIAAGPNVAQVETKLLEHKVITHQAMKAKKSSVLDSGNVTASQGLDLAQEMMNDSKRELTGGVEEEDVSRYQVTVNRRFVKDILPWTGEVTGRPQFIPLRTVDIVAAGQAIVVLDKNNKKLWDAKLTFPVGSTGDLFEDVAIRVPCIEAGNALYFADKGMLTCFDLASGSARWRFNSVGISGVHADEKGKIYVETAGADPDTLKYSQEVNIHDKGNRFIMKLDEQSGKVLWRSVRPGFDYRCTISGPFVYAIRDWQTQDPLRFEDGPDHRFSLTLLDPSNGNLIWTYPRINHPVSRMDIEKNWILLHFDDEVVVLKFFSL